MKHLKNLKLWESWFYYSSNKNADLTFERILPNILIYTLMSVEKIDVKNK